MEWRFNRDTTTYSHVRNLEGSAAGTGAVGSFRAPIGLTVFRATSERHPTAERMRLVVSESNGRRAQLMTALGRPLQVIVPPHRSPVAGRLGGVCVATRANTDPAYDAHRLIVIGREMHAMYVYRRQQTRATGGAG
jgi:hypothetical protein